MLRDPTTITGKPLLRVSCTRVLANVWPIVDYYNFELIEKERKNNGIAGGGGEEAPCAFSYSVIIFLYDQAKYI